VRFIPGAVQKLGRLFQGASILAKVARMESLGARKSPSIGESKSSIRKTAFRRLMRRAEERK
jgi:hypothetical protein